MSKNLVLATGESRYRVTQGKAGDVYFRFGIFFAFNEDDAKAKFKAKFADRYDSAVPITVEKLPD